MNLRNSVLISSGVLFAATYEVGPGKPMAKIADVPWASLSAGDLVLIHWSPETYKEKWVIGRSGTAAAPIVIRGVANAEGKLPVIDGNGAATVPGLVYQNADRGLIKIGGSDVPNDRPRAAYISIENLEVRGTKTQNVYFAAGETRGRNWAINAAGIYIERGNNVTIRNCLIHDNANGVFMGIGRDFLLEGNYILDNGYGGGNSEHHNIYIQGVGVTIQYNRFGPLKPGSEGNNIKDRSAGTVIRYNWIEGGNRQLDLVEHGEPEIQTDPKYRETFVYGNTMIEYEANDNNQFVHYGGDSGNRQFYRKGALYLHNNTMVSFRTSMTTMLRMSTMDERADIRNNVVWVATGAPLMLSYDFGNYDMRNNWLPQGYAKSELSNPPSLIRENGTMTGATPGFSNPAGMDFRPQSASPLHGAGAQLAVGASQHPVLREYVKHQQSRERARGSQDIGAFEGRDPAPALSQASALGVASPYAFFSLYGQDLARTTAAWASAIADGRLPVELEGVRVRVDGKDAYVNYVSPSQINILTPADARLGEVPVEVTTPYGPATGRMQIAPSAPFVFSYPAGGKQHVAAIFNGETIPAGPAFPARPGDNLVVYATGLGATSPAAPPGVVLDQAYALANASDVKVTIGGVDAPVQYVGMTFAGAFQVNVQVPRGVGDGEQAFLIRAGERTSQSGVVLVCESR